MKIDGKKPGLDRPLDRIESAKPSAPGLARAKAAPAVDYIRVSAEARLAREAVEQAQAASLVRPEAVERGKALLASGQLGADAKAVADAIIDTLIEES